MIKKRFLTILLITISLNTTLLSQQMLWKVKGNYGGNVYLLGSIHVGKADLYPLSKAINRAFNASNYLVLEAKLNTQAKLIMQEALYDKGKLPENDTLENYISEPLYLLLQNRLEQFKLPKNSMDRYKPWVAAVTIASLEMAELGYSSIFGIDQHFWQRAHQLNKPVFSVEGAALQVSLLSQDDAKFQEQLLAMQLDELHEKSEVETMFTQWKEGNDSYFVDDVMVNFGMYDKVKDQLYTKRNTQMIKKIQRYMNNSRGRSYFFVVGVAHLVGKEGVIAQLKAKNIKVTRY